MDKYDVEQMNRATDLSIAIMDEFGLTNFADSLIALRLQGMNLYTIPGDLGKAALYVLLAVDAIGLSSAIPGLADTGYPFAKALLSLEVCKKFADGGGA